MISSSHNCVRLSNWILVIQCQWNVCGSPGVDALFLLTVHHSGESAQTQAASAHTAWQTGGVSPTLAVQRHAGAWHNLLTRERESAPKQQATNHISKKAPFFIQSANGSPGQVGLSAVVFIWSPVMGMGASFLSDQRKKEDRRKWKDSQLYYHAIFKNNRNNNWSFSTFLIHFCPKWFHSINLT